MIGIGLLCYGECFAFYYYALQCHTFLRFTILAGLTILVSFTMYTSIKMQYGDPVRAKKLGNNFYFFKNNKNI
jgi:hypothetical protein